MAAYRLMRYPATRPSAASPGSPKMLMNGLQSFADRVYQAEMLDDFDGDVAGHDHLDHHERDGKAVRQSSL